MNKKILLYIDTTDRKNIVLRLKIDADIFEKKENAQYNKNQEVLPLIHSFLQEHSLTVHDLTAIEVNPGPGSFTGIRVGIAIAQALGYALQIPVTGVEPTYSL